MTGTAVFAPGGYRYIPAVFQYSGGVAAEDGFELERARFMAPVPLAEAFAAVEAHLKAIGRPITAFAQCELRSPAPFTDQGFIDFNKQYVTTLERWGIYKDGVNPVARTNVCPMYDEPAEPSMLAFTYTVPAATRAPHLHAVRRRRRPRRIAALQRAHRALRRHARPRDCARRWSSSSTRWSAGSRRSASAGRMRSARRPTPCRTSAIWSARNWRRRGAIESGLVWHYARPPVIGLEYEMDVRGTARELII